MNNIYNETKFILNKYGIHANKSLGQNFLINEEVINQIIEKAEIDENDLVIEIGPGLGTLTSRLLEKAGKVICVELDDRMITILNDRFKLYNNFELIHDDILKVDLNKIINENLFENNNIKKIKIVANLPYYITTPIIKHIINQDIRIHSMIFMVQDEVANRFTARPKTRDYGSITLYLKYYFNIEKLFKVSKKAFSPVPKVESAVIKFTERLDKPLVDKDIYFKLINDAFSQKRKTLKNNLKDYDFNLIKKILEANNLNELVRAEELDEEIFIAIAKSLNKQ